MTDRQPVVAQPLRAALLRVLLDEGLLRPGNEGDAEGGRLIDDYNERVVEVAALAVEAVRPETDIDEERLARALHESDAAGCSSVDRPGEHTVEPHSFDFEDAKRLAAAYRATPTERPE